MADRRYLYLNHSCTVLRTPIHKADGHLIGRSHEVSKPRDFMLEWLDRSEFWQASRQCCCRGARQISERLEKSKPEYCGFATSRNHAVRRLVNRGHVVFTRDCSTFIMITYWSMGILSGLVFLVYELTLQTALNGYSQLVQNLSDEREYIKTYVFW